MMKKYKYAFFDFDGVVVDSELIRINTYKNLFYELYEIDINIDKTMIGRSEQLNLKNLLTINKLQFNQKIIANLKKVRSKMLISEAEKGFKTINSVMDIISGLQAMNIPMAIVTNSSYEYIASAFSTLKIDLDSFLISSSDDVSLPKPNPEIYKKTLSKAKCSKDEVLAFEDSPSGVCAAKAAGIETVAVHSSFDESLLHSKYHLYLDSKNNVTQILSLFDNSNA